MLRPRCPPRVVQLEALVAEIGPAVGAALCGLERLGRLTELAHHSHTAQADGVAIPVKGKEWLRRFLMLIVPCVGIATIELPSENLESRSVPL